MHSRWRSWTQWGVPGTRAPLAALLATLLAALLARWPMAGSHGTAHEASRSTLSVAKERGSVLRELSAQPARVVGAGAEGGAEGGGAEERAEGPRADGSTPGRLVSLAAAAAS